MLGYWSCLGIIYELPILVWSNREQRPKIGQAGFVHRIPMFGQTRLWMPRDELPWRRAQSAARAGSWCYLLIIIYM